MTNTAITTTARRIARELNSLPAHFWVAFDADGHVLDRSYGQDVDHSHLWKSEGVAQVVPSRPDAFGHRWDQRGVQAYLDETAEMDAAYADGRMQAAAAAAIADLQS